MCEDVAKSVAVKNKHRIDKNFLRAEKVKTDGDGDEQKRSAKNKAGRYQGRDHTFDRAAMEASQVGRGLVRTKLNHTNTAAGALVFGIQL